MTDEPFDEYLWDRTGVADPRLRELEQLLSRFRHAPRAPAPGEEPDADVNEEPEG